MADRLRHPDQHELNEVLANRASELLGGLRGEGRLVHPNDEVNKSQSSNDVFPSAMNLARHDHHPAPAARSGDPEHYPGRQGGGLRRHRQDRPHPSAGCHPAHPGQEFSGWVAQLEQGSAISGPPCPICASWRWGHCRRHRPQHPARLRRRGGRHPGRADRPAAGERPNKFEALAASDALVHGHGALKTLAASLMKIANDVRWLASGPRSGLGSCSSRKTSLAPPSCPARSTRPSARRSPCCAPR